MEHVFDVCGLRCKICPVDALAYALLLLRYRSRSRRELERRLLSKGYSRDEVEEVLERLDDMGYIDDVEMARDYVRAGVERGWSRIRIIRGLRERGVEEGAISEAMEEYDEDRVVRVLKMKLRGKGREEVIRFLRNRGFGWDMIRRVLSDE